MICDKIENAGSYQTISPRIAAALRFLRRPDVAELPVGRHEVEADHVFALVQEYSTKPASECFWEAHRKHIDVQFIASGVEAIGWSPIQNLTVKTAYDDDKDFMALDGAGQTITLGAGNFAIFFPHDAHMPCLASKNPVPVKKIVIKVAV